MKVLIVDDEQPARARLKQLLEDEPAYEFAGEAENGSDAVRLAAKVQPDIVLLDIRMPGLDGIETARHLNALDYPPAIVFATAYDEYAMDAFDARAVGYVLKPVRRSRLTAALEQASRLAPSTLTSVASQAKLPVTRRHVCAHAHGELRLIPIAEIHCFRADQKYVTVDHENGHDLIDEPLKALADEFSDDFVVTDNLTVPGKAIYYIFGVDEAGSRYWIPWPRRTHFAQADCYQGVAARGTVVDAPGIGPYLEVCPDECWWGLSYFDNSFPMDQDPPPIGAVVDIYGEIISGMEGPYIDADLWLYSGIGCTVVGTDDLNWGSLKAQYR